MKKRSKILLTRHQQAAGRTAQALQERGFEAIQLPLSEIELLDNPFPAGEYSGVILTSAVAARIIGENQLDLSQQASSELLALPAFCVGKHTAKCAEQAGFSNVKKVTADATGLAQEIIKDAGGNNFIYPCAEQRSFDFVEALASDGSICTNWEIYANRLIVPDREELATSLEKTKLVLLYSKRTTAHFFETVETVFGKDFWQPHLAQHHFIAISPQVAGLVPRILRANTYIANDKNQNSMIECLEANDR